MGGMQTFATAVESLQKSFKKMNPFCIPFAIQNMGGAMLAMDLGFMGPNYPIATACATGNYCILRWGWCWGCAGAAAAAGTAGPPSCRCWMLDAWASPRCCSSICLACRPAAATRQPSVSPLPCCPTLALPRPLTLPPSPPAPGSAADHIRRGEADLMLAGGSEAVVIPSAIGGFIACKALSKRNEDPAAASRPWDRDRDGFVMGEGAGGWVRVGVGWGAL